MSGSTIGIKVADGSYYPVLEEGFTGRKKLTLTTVKDNQAKVQIDLYRGDGRAIADAQYLASLIIENIAPAPQGEPEIELLIGIDEEGELSAEALDTGTGETQKISVSLTTLPEEDTYQVPDFQVPDPELDFEEPALTGETYPVGEEDRRKERPRRKKPSIWLLVLFVALGLALVTVIAFLVFDLFEGPEIPRPTTGGTAPATQPAAGQELPKTEASQTTAVTGTSSAAAPAKPSAKAVTYRIKKGDTLWDIASTYYRNPWLYPRLAKANSIKNPDLIIAGTRIVIPED